MLIVDDDAEMLEVLTEMLALVGAEVRAAPSAKGALQLLEEFHPEVVLCDIEMPGEDGYSFIRKVRARSAARGGNVPALALTAMARPEDRTQALAAGFQMHLAKPVDLGRLTRAVEDLSRLAPSAVLAG